MAEKSANRSSASGDEFEKGPRNRRQSSDPESSWLPGSHVTASISNYLGSLEYLREWIPPLNVPYLSWYSTPSVPLDHNLIKSASPTSTESSNKTAPPSPSLTSLLFRLSQTAEESDRISLISGSLPGNYRFPCAGAMSLLSHVTREYWPQVMLRIQPCLVDPQNFENVVLRVAFMDEKERAEVNELVRTMSFGGGGLEAGGVVEGGSTAVSGGESGSKWSDSGTRRSGSVGSGYEMTVSGLSIDFLARMSYWFRRPTLSRSSPKVIHEEKWTVVKSRKYTHSESSGGNTYSLASQLEMEQTASTWDNLHPTD